MRIKQVFFISLDFLLYCCLPTPEIDLSSNSDKKVVLFLGDSLQARIPRMAKWLQRKGNYRCVLMTAHGKGFQIFNTEIFTEVLSYRSSWDLKRKLKGLKGVDLIHAFTIPSLPIKIAIDHADSPVIMDMQDMYVSYFGLKSPKLYMRMDMPNEAYSIRNADGLVSHSVELSNACKEYEVDKRPPTLFFPVYADEDYAIEPEEIKPLDEIHIVYAGSIAGSFQDDQHFGSMKLFWLIEEFARQKIHFHIYPSPNMRFRDLILSEYHKIEAENPYFHMHESVKQDQLAKELGQYSFGLLPFFLEDTSRSFNKLGRGSSQKLYNYMEAVIPVIISEDLAFQAWMAGRYGGGIKVKKKDFYRMREIIEGIDYVERRKEILKNREKVFLGANIPRLIAFYEEVLAKGKKKK